ncbi:MAG: hypothetical protein JSV90_09015 [Methanobacteriota archaeon]|nr:MAG: hypothetical protein JSV90_09015 [Euryarchaeota archaeon]
MPAVEETVSAEPAEETTPEPVSPPKKAEKKKMLIVVIAIIVVAALIGTAVLLLFMPSGKDLEASMDPEEIPPVPAGDTQALSIVEVEYGGDPVDDSDLSYSWSVTPTELGSFDYEARADVNFEAGNEGGSGTIECVVTYDDEDVSVTVSADVTVLDPVLESVVIVPSSATIMPDEDRVFNATAYDSVGGVVTGAAITWSVTGMDVGDYTLSPTSGASTTFSASVEGEATLTAEATDGTNTVSSTATVNVSTVVYSRSVDYYWYDMFNVPIGEHYDWRANTTKDEWRLTDEFPYLYMWAGAPPGNIWIYSFMRMEIDGRNMTDLNMNENPEFIPYLGDARGGTAVLDWYMYYPTYDEADAKLSEGAMAWFDGWFIELMGTTTLDEQAAKAVLGVSTTEQFEDFDNWWAANGLDVKAAWEAWMINEASNDRLAIFNSYDYDLQFMLFELDAEKVGDEVVVTFDTISWGAEALMFRWFREAFMETEWWMEDMTLEATIGPERANLFLDAAIEYGIYAYETTNPAGRMCWSWEPLISDYIESTLLNPYSAFDPYADFTYENWAPGSEWYGEDMPWDYTPYCWNLTENETLVIEWPEEDVWFFAHDIDELGTGTLVNDTLEFKLPMTGVYAEPQPSDLPDVVAIDTESRQITYEGPFDFWTWSREQETYQWITDQWAEYEILPYGFPWIEFLAETGDVLDIEISGLEGPYEVGEEATFTVTIINRDTNETHTGYQGTVTFSSSDDAAVLPDNYTFVPGDAGTHDFTVVFNTVDPVLHEATHLLTVYDVDDTSISDTASDILVVEPEMIDRFVVEFSGDDVIALESTSVTVTAYNQWDGVFEGYEGTVNFTSDDAGAVLPDNYTFTAGLMGTRDFNVTFSTPGPHDVNVTDVAHPEASGEAMVTVQAAAMADHLVLTGVRDPAPLDDQPETMKVTVYDQYDREYRAYDGEVGFESNNSDMNLPAPTTFTLGQSNLTVSVEFLAEGSFMLYCNDTSEPTINGTLAVEVVSTVFLDHFEVTGIEDMWEGNSSDVTVRAIDNYDGTFEDYDGTIVFSSDAVSGATLPPDYTFVPGDLGEHTFPSGVSFDEPGTYSVMVEDSLDDTKNGSQDNIVIDDLVADSLTMSDVPASVMQGDSFSVTVTAYHQHGEVFTEYDGTVTFTSSDVGASLPSDYTFLPGDMGARTFTDELTLATVGPQTVTVTDTGDGTLTDTATIDVTPAASAWVQYKVYDMFEEPVHRHWGLRWDTYGTDAFLTNDTGNATMLYFPEGVPSGDPADYDQTLIYAPYRWNVTGELLPNANVHDPEFMPVLGSTVTGAEASVLIRFQYMTEEWWDGYWVTEWSWHPDWVSRLSKQGIPDTEPGGVDEGYVIGTYYNVSMNRAAAEEWIGLPQSEGDVEAWWGANRAGYETDWTNWIDDEGNNRLNIWAGYEDLYYVNGVIIELYEAGPDEVYMEIAHFNWGYEVLMCRWLNETGISTHQPWYEDFEMVIDYHEDTIDIEMDAACQYSMHCNKANESALPTGAPCAWVWEPLKIDYAPSSEYSGPTPPPSEYDPYEALTYQGWNCGSCRYGATDPAYYDEYETAPNNFSLPDYGTLIFELPHRDDVLGYYGEAVTPDAPINAWMWMDEIGGDIDEYIALQHRGSVELGWHNLGAADYFYDYVGKVLTINGSFDWYDWRDEGEGTMWHGAPWIEFNVVESTMAAAASGLPSVPLEEPVPSGSSSPATSGATTASAEMLSLLSVACAVLITTFVMATGVVRRPELR